MQFPKSWISACSKFRDLERETKLCSQVEANMFILEIKYVFSSRTIGTTWFVFSLSGFAETGRQQTLLQGRLTSTGFAGVFLSIESDHIPPLVPAVCPHQEAPYSSSATFPKRSWIISDLQKAQVWHQAGSTDDPNGNENFLKNLRTSRVNLITRPRIRSKILPLGQTARAYGVTAGKAHGMWHVSINTLLGTYQHFQVTGQWK